MILGRRTPLLTGMVMGLAGLADVFFYGHTVGWTVAGYGMLLAVLVWYRGGARLRDARAGWVAWGLAGLLLSLAWEPGWLKACLAAAGLVCFSLMTREQIPLNPAVVVVRFWRFFRRGWFQMFRDVRMTSRWRRRKGVGSRRGFVRTWAIPVGLTLVFVVLLAMGNPILSRWIWDCWRAVRNGLRSFLEMPEPGRLGFWMLVAIWSWALFRVRSAKSSRGSVPLRKAVSPAVDFRSGDDVVVDLGEIGRAFFAGLSVPGNVTRCLALFNVVFFAQTALDLVYLWGGRELPQGMTYAEYAHRGAYPLVATALLAAVFVLWTFRSGGAAERDPIGRRLVFGWIGQNIFLTVSSLWRLWLYVGSYSMTRWRVAAGLWMFLVAAGLIWIIWRIRAGRSNAWLFHVNVATACVVLYASAFVNFDGVIAGFNVRHCREIRGVGPALDVEYLAGLGPESLPALHWVSNRLKDVPVGRLAAEREADVRRELDVKLLDWRGWTVQRWLLRSE
ncbi:MAG: DUF4173 domain-containing protein [Planctomycetota bacterium]